VQDRVKAPAIALIIVAALNALTGITLIFGRGMTMAIARSWMSAADYADLERRVPPPNLVVEMLQCMVLLAICALIAFGGFGMLKLRYYGLAITASVLAMVPCCDLCCPIGIPVGIWALVVLAKPDVKQAFAV